MDDIEPLESEVTSCPAVQSHGEACMCLDTCRTQLLVHKHQHLHLYNYTDEDHCTEQGIVESSSEIQDSKDTLASVASVKHAIAAIEDRLRNCSPPLLSTTVDESSSSGDLLKPAAIEETLSEGVSTTACSDQAQAGATANCDAADKAAAVEKDQPEQENSPSSVSLQQEQVLETQASDTAAVSTEADAADAAALETTPSAVKTMSAALETTPAAAGTAVETTPAAVETCTAAVGSEAAEVETEAADPANGAPAASQQSEDEGLELVVWPDEAVAYSQLGHLFKWASNTKKVNVSIPPAASVERVVDTIRLAWNFKQLAHLHIQPVAATWRVNQAVLVSLDKTTKVHVLTLKVIHCMPAFAYAYHFLTVPSECHLLHLTSSK